MKKVGFRPCVRVNVNALVLFISAKTGLCLYPESYYFLSLCCLLHIVNSKDEYRKSHVFEYTVSFFGTENCK